MVATDKVQVGLRTCAGWEVEPRNLEFFHQEIERALQTESVQKNLARTPPNSEFLVGLQRLWLELAWIHYDITISPIVGV